MTASSHPVPLRVLVADDHPVFRDGLRLMLQSSTGVELIGEASNGSEAVSASLALAPDIVLMDLQMPELDGIEATRQIAANCPETAVIVLTMVENDASVMSAMRAGARGYLLKESSCPEILRAIEAVASRHAVFGSAVARRLLHHIETSRTEAEVAFPQLTEREREILHLVAQGASNQTIASQLFLSGKTVRNHVSNILTKIQASDRAQAIVRARQAGMGSRPPR